VLRIGELHFPDYDARIVVPVQNQNGSSHLLPVLDVVDDHTLRIGL
jgi:hypothetical protein